MDILYFLEERTKFTRYYYETAASPFREIQRKIDANEPPFDDPPWGDSGEPAFLEEWLTAEDGVRVLDRSRGRVKRVTDRLLLQRDYARPA
jgi:hypothetical protein